jgi:hypothetical protein
MTYGWNRSPENQRRGDPVLRDQEDDPGLSSRYGDPDGPGDGDSAWALPGDLAAGPGRTTARGGGFGRHDAQRNADTWSSGDTAISPVVSSHWQPGYEPLGHPRPGNSRAGDVLPGSARRPGARHRDARQSDAGQDEARPGDFPPGGAWRSGARADDASPGIAPDHTPYQPPGYAPVGYQGGGEPSAGDDPEPFGFQPSHQPAGGFSPTQAYRSIDPPQARGGGAPAGYQPPAYQPPGAADVLSYGYRTDPADAAYQRSEPSPGGVSALSRPGPAREPDWFGQPDWVREPDTGGLEAGQPEFVLHGPSGSEPGAVAGRSFRAGAPRRGAARGRRSRVWIGVGVLLVIGVAAAAVFYGKVGRSGHATPPPAGPAHTLATPQTIGAYGRDQQAEKVLDLSHNEQYVKQIAPGHVSGIVAAVYDTGGPASSPDRVAIIAGRLANSAPADVIKSFMQQEASDRNAPTAVPAGPLGGQAACAGTGKSGICLWADADTVGVLVSATINPGTLSRQMLSIRSGVEIPAA